MCIRVGGDRAYVVGQAMELVEYAAPVRQLPVEEVVSEVVPLAAEPAPQPDFAAPEFVPPQFVSGNFAQTRFPRPEPIKPDFPGPSSPPPVSPPAARREASPIRTPFDREPPQPTGRPVLRYVLMAIAAIVLLTVLYLNRFSLIPRPPLEIKMSETEGQIMVQWNPAALEGIDEGTVVLNDGGQFQTITLNRQLLASGWLRSPRKSGRVIAKLTAGDITGLGTWSAPETANPAPAPNVVAPASRSPGR
jgi:hypothetical protein